MSEIYDRIGVGYSRARSGDPRIAARIEAALGDARTVLNVGAGSGSYEPAGREVTALEPSAEMIAQRPAGSAPVIKGRAEQLPFPDDSFDAAMAILTIHHWPDLQAGLAELGRVASGPIVLLTIDADQLRDLWISADYFPAIGRLDAARMPRLEQLRRVFPEAEWAPVDVLRDCTDLFGLALWGRPEAVLDPHIRNGSSVWQQIPREALNHGLRRLRRDLEDGSWDRRYGHLRRRASLDVGLRLVQARPR